MQDTGQNQEEGKVQVGQAIQPLQDRAFTDATFTSPGNTNAALDFKYVFLSPKNLSAHPSGTETAVLNILMASHSVTNHTGHSPPTLQTPLPDHFVHGPYTPHIASYLQEVDQYRAFLCLPSSDVPPRGQTATVLHSQDRERAKI